MWVWWTIAGVALAVGEMAIMGFFLGPFAGGAFVAAIFSLAGAGAVPSIVSFAVITALLFLFVRPVAQRHLHQPAETRTGTAALIGRSGMVLERIANDVSVGVDTVLYFTITEPKDATYEIANPLQAIEQLTVTTLRNIIGSLTLEETLTSRDEVNDKLRIVLDERTGKWGIRINGVELKSTDPAGGIQEAVAQQLSA